MKLLSRPPMWFIYRQLTARRLTAAALALWATSLMLPLLGTYSGTAVWGYLYLLVGWIGALEELGWWAHPLLLFGAARLLLTQKVTIFPSLLAFFCALDTFRLDSFLLHMEGSGGPVFGPGFGAILLLLAVCLMLAASGARLEEAVERSLREASRGGVFLKPIGVVLFAALAAVSVALGVYDRSTGNELERKRLTGAAFKRGPVCRDRGFAPKISAQPAGPLEISGSTNLLSLWDTPLEALQWGLPVVRMRGFDHFLVGAGPLTVVAARPAMGAPQARLQASIEQQTSTRFGDVRLMLTDSDGVLFDRTWKQELPNHFLYCPDYSDRPRPHQDPRELLLATLGIADAQLDNVVQQSLSNLTWGWPVRDEILQGEVTGISDDDPSLDARKWISCPSDVELDVNRQYRLDEYPWLGSTLGIGATRYFTGIERSMSPHVACRGNAAYVFGVIRAEYPKLLLVGQKWSLSGPRIEWVRRLQIADRIGRMPAHELRVISVREDPHQLRLELGNEKLGRRVSVEFSKFEIGHSLAPAPSK